jgi:hypothetical protein
MMTGQLLADPISLPLTLHSLRLSHKVVEEGRDDRTQDRPDTINYDELISGVRPTEEQVADIRAKGTGRVEG